MNTRFFRLVVISFIGLALFGCSGNSNSEGKKEAKKDSTEQTKEAIKEYGTKPIGKARAAQQAGQDRTDAIDNALKQD